MYQINQVSTILSIILSRNYETFDTINPATEDILATVQRAKEGDVDVAVKASKDAFHIWRDVSGCHRRDLLLKFSDLMEMNQQYLAEIESG